MTLLPNHQTSRGATSDLFQVIPGRRSVRAFTSELVERHQIIAAIEAAGWAPSPHGRQPWRFVVVESQVQRTALSDAMAETWHQQLQLDGQSPEVLEIRLAKSRERLVMAPVLVIVCLYPGVMDPYPDAERQEAERIMAIQSLGAAVQNFLLTIFAQGLDAGWMCAPLFCPQVVRDVCGIAEPLEPHALIPVGHAAKDPVRRPRLPVEDLIVGWL